SRDWSSDVCYSDLDGIRIRVYRRGKKNAHKMGINAIHGAILSYLRHLLCTCQSSYGGGTLSPNFTGEYQHTCSPCQSLNKRNCPLPTSAKTCFKTSGS